MKPAKKRRRPAARRKRPKRPPNPSDIAWVQVQYLMLFYHRPLKALANGLRKEFLGRNVLVSDVRFHLAGGSFCLSMNIAREPVFEHSALELMALSALVTLSLEIAGGNVRFTAAVLGRGTSFAVHRISRMEETEVLGMLGQPGPEDLAQQLWAAVEDAMPAPRLRIRQDQDVTMPHGLEECCGALLQALAEEVLDAIEKAGLYSVRFREQTIIYESARGFWIARDRWWDEERRAVVWFKVALADVQKVRFSIFLRGADTGGGDLNKQESVATRDAVVTMLACVDRTALAGSLEKSLLECLPAPSPKHWMPVRKGEP